MATISDIGETPRIASDHLGRHVALVIPSTHEAFVSACRMLGMSSPGTLNAIEHVRRFVRHDLFVVCGPASTRVSVRLDVLYRSYLAWAVDDGHIGDDELLIEKKFLQAIRHLGLAYNAGNKSVSGVVMKCDVLAPSFGGVP